ncbi:RusA family crossover junction endodeoxyribonuclease [Lutibacter sp. B2]|nr:RusA family crossover junction endodeoxyribonuclease [Lutibacter sp. B2]
MIKIIVPGKPITKSNFKLKNIHGHVWMPKQGKHSKYIAYENKIAGYINQQYDGPTLTGNIITIINLYFPDKRMGDLHNYPKSICDGIEKSGIIENDRQLKPVLLFDYIDKENPRIEIELYECDQYKVHYSIEPINK